MQKICDLVGVAEYCDGLPVELWRHGPTGRLVIRAYSECGHAYADVDLGDLLGWLESGPAGTRLVWTYPGFVAC